MTTEKTAKAWFEMLKEPYRSQAIKASEEYPFVDATETYKSLDDAIVFDFVWHETGLDEQWQEIHDSIERGETTYLADDNDTNDGCRNLLDEIIKYIEDVEDKIEGEWGSRRPLDQLIKENAMPDVYYKLVSMRELPEPPQP